MNQNCLQNINNSEITEPSEIIRQSLDSNTKGSIALVSSFGAESAVLLHMVADIDPNVPVLFIDTGKLFSQTLEYQQLITQDLGLSSVRVIKPKPEKVKLADADGDLHKIDPRACCALRKVEPLREALEGFDGWITGRKRYHGDARSTLAVIERTHDQLKINPLAYWTSGDVVEYLNKHNLRAHPLIKAGYQSIGCAPCTAPSCSKNIREGRWQGQTKTECGIHFINGKVIRKAEVSNLQTRI